MGECSYSFYFAHFLHIFFFSRMLNSMETAEKEILHLSAAKFLIMFEKEFMDEKDMLVSHV